MTRLSNTRPRGAMNRKEYLVGLAAKLKLMKELDRLIRDLERSEDRHRDGLGLQDHYRLCQLKRDFRRYAEEKEEFDHEP